MTDRRVRSIQNRINSWMWSSRIKMAMRLTEIPVEINMKLITTISLMLRSANYLFYVFPRLRFAVDLPRGLWGWCIDLRYK